MTVTPLFCGRFLSSSDGYLFAGEPQSVDATTGAPTPRRRRKAVDRLSRLLYVWTRAFLECGLLNCLNCKGVL
jgi:hypothetical protein